MNVEGDAIVQAGNDLTIEGRADSTTTETYSKTDTSTVTAGVKRLCRYRVSRRCGGKSR